jgi:hypothetical protein
MGVAVYGLATKAEGGEGAEGATALLPLTRAALDVGAGADGTDDGSTSPARRFNCATWTEEKKEKKWLKRIFKTIREKKSALVIEGSDAENDGTIETNRNTSSSSSARFSRQRLRFLSPTQLKRQEPPRGAPLGEGKGTLDPSRRTKRLHVASTNAPTAHVEGTMWCGKTTPIKRAKQEVHNEIGHT